MTPCILVTLSNQCFSLNPLFYAGELAIRLQAKVYVLFILTVSRKNPQIEEEKFLKEIGPALDNYREKGVCIQSYFIKDKFLEEATKFIEEIHPDIVIVAKLQQQNLQFSAWLNTIRQNIPGSLIVVDNFHLKKEPRKMKVKRGFDSPIQ